MRPPAARAVPRGHPTNAGAVLGLCVLVSLVLAAATALPLSGPGRASAATPDTHSHTVDRIELDGEIDSAAERWVRSALGDAADRDEPLAIIRIDTPGGLDTSMRGIVRAIIDAPMPVVVHVAPNGARAASAGLFVVQAGDVAAMAPQTNIGAATPIQGTGKDIGGTLGRKVTNDAAAFVGALASDHGRNSALAERMVRDAVSVPAQRAHDQHLVDLLAADDGALLSRLDGFRVRGPKAQTLHTAGLSVRPRQPSLGFQLLAVLTNPTVAFLLLLLGALGLALEALSPGLVIPGALGAISLLLGLFGASMLPVTAIGAGLLLVGVALLIAETQLPTAGILGIGGVAALIAGGLLLVDTDSGAQGTSSVAVVVIALVLAATVVWIGTKALQARRRPVHSGAEQMVGALAQVRAPLLPEGQVFVAGELWRARSVDHQPVRSGAVRVVGMDGLTLVVEAAGGGSAEDEPRGEAVEGDGRAAVGAETRDEARAEPSRPSRGGL